MCRYTSHCPICDQWFRSNRPSQRTSRLCRFCIKPFSLVDLMFRFAIVQKYLEAHWSVSLSSFPFFFPTPVHPKPPARSLKGYGEATLAQNKTFSPRKPGTAAVIDHGITTRRTGAELLERVGVDSTVAGSAVARHPRPAAPRVRLVLTFGPSSCSRCGTFKVSTRTGRKHRRPDC